MLQEAAPLKRDSVRAFGSAPTRCGRGKMIHQSILSLEGLAVDLRECRKHLRGSSLFYGRLIVSRDPFYVKIHIKPRVI
jgi:hypothetical protein